MESMVKKFLFSWLFEQTSGIDGVILRAIEFNLLKKGLLPQEMESFLYILTLSSSIQPLKRQTKQIMF